VSALTGDGLADLISALYDWVQRRLTLDAEEGGFVATARQASELDALARDLDASVRALEADDPTEAVLVTLRGALGACDDLVGVRVPDAILERIFSKFCVGK
jgi:tRNA modification GTPase